MKSAITPLTASELLEIANTPNAEIPMDRALATFADPRNWVQIYKGETSPASGYTAKACEWAFIGPVRPPYELAQNALAHLC